MWLNMFKQSQKASYLIQTNKIMKIQLLIKS